MLFVVFQALVSVVLIVFGVLRFAVTWRGIRGGPGRSVAGVRTPATLRNEDAFAAGNRAAAPAGFAGSAVLVVTGVIAAFVNGGVALAIIAVLGLAGGIVLTGAGGMLGHRAAALVPDAPTSAAAGGCGGCCCGAGGCGG